LPVLERGNRIAKLSVRAQDLPIMSISLQVTNLCKEYSRSNRSPLLAVAGINFSVSKGECFGLLGPNGAGKSTSMKCITGFYEPTSGSVEILGIDVHKNPKAARQGLGVCNQDDTLDTDFSVLDQMVQFASFFSISRKVATTRAEALLERFGLTQKAKEPVEALSGGMRRRLQVARALINEPRLLVLDEPTTGLDPEARRALWDILVEQRRRGLAILLSTHYMEEAERLCDRVAIIHRGKILACDSPQSLITREMGTDEVEEELRPGIRIRRQPHLEDVYLKITGATLDGSSSRFEDEDRT
jgi:lipooligosaccharide transport system ATP-binding protein